MNSNFLLTCDLGQVPVASRQLTGVTTTT